MMMMMMKMSLNINHISEMALYESFSDFASNSDFPPFP